MKNEFLLPYYTAKNGSGVGMFNTTMGKLQRQLRKGEYDMFKYAPVFESDFIQITKKGEVIDVHNRVRMVTVGIACTSPSLPLPDVMLLARPTPGSEELAGHGHASKGKNCKAAKTLELTRLLPLKFVRISVQNREKQQLRLKFATGRSCYLQLCPPLEAREDLFAYWENLIYLLRPPVESNSSTYAIPAEDPLCMPLLGEEDGMHLAAADPQGKGDLDQVSIRSLHLVSDVNGVTSAAYIGGEGIPYDAHKSTTVPGKSSPKRKSAELAKELATGTKAEAAAMGGVAGTLSMKASRSADSGQVSAAVAGVAATGAKESRSHVAIAGTGRMSPNSMKLALAGAVSKSNEYVSHIATSLSPENSMDAAIARVGSPSKSDPLKMPLMSTLPSGSFLGEQAEEQRVSRSTSRAHKGRRERRERRGKDRAVGRSSHHSRAGDSLHRRGGDQISRKSPSHRASGEKAKGSPRHSRSHKGAGHIPIAKESRNAHKWGRSFSNASSSSTNKRLGRISSFLRNIRANLAAKGLASQNIRDVDIVAKTVDRTQMDAIMETGESGKDLEIVVGSVTSEVMESMTFDAR